MLFFSSHDQSLLSFHVSRRCRLLFTTIYSFLFLFLMINLLFIGPQPVAKGMIRATGQKKETSPIITPSQILATMAVEDPIRPRSWVREQTKLRLDEEQYVEDDYEVSSSTDMDDVLLSDTFESIISARFWQDNLDREDEYDAR